MNIEETLKKAAEYFKNKVLSGEFEFKSCEEHTATIIIDGEYEFEMWISNEPKDWFRFYEGSFSNVTPFYKYMGFRTQKERLKAWGKLKPHIIEYKEKVLKREKQKQLNRLQKELDALK